jgi:AAA domain
VTIDWSEAESIPFEVRADLPPPLTEEELALAGSERNGRELESQPTQAEPVTLKVTTSETFAAEEEEGADPLLGDKDNVVIAQGGDVMIYGDGGAGKTTLEIDLACHLAAGDPWLGIPVPRPLSVLLIENEGPRPLFRRKLKRKLESWTGSPIGDRLLVAAEPWAQFTFADPEWRKALAGTIHEREIDVYMGGPLTASGMEDAGTIQECRTFLALVDEVRAASGRPVAFVHIHHDSKSHVVSGAWEGVGDGLFHVQKRERGRTGLHFQKARWASEYHGTKLELVWTEGESFTVVEKVEIPDEHAAELILAFVEENGDTSWGKVEKALSGKGAGVERLRAIRDGRLAAGELVNRKGDALLDHIETSEAGRSLPCRLYVAADPAIAHLRRNSVTARHRRQSATRTFRFDRPEAFQARSPAALCRLRATRSAKAARAEPSTQGLRLDLRGRRGLRSTSGRGQAASVAVREAVRLNLELPDTIIEAIAQRAAAIVLEQNGSGSPWMTRAQAAEYCALPLSRLEKDKTIPCHRDNRRVLYHRDELDDHFRGLG